jgi:predicted Zn finger-like uncharacterized protein
MEREAFVCPFCGAPEKDTPSSTTAETKCRYCGSLIRVPRQLVRLTRRCPNHPESLSTGICRNCGQAFCEQCLNVWNESYAEYYLCPRCYEKQNRTNEIIKRLFIGIGLGLVFIGLLPGLNASMHGHADVYAQYISKVGLFLIVMGLSVLYLGGLYGLTNKPMGTMQKQLEESRAITEGTYARCPHCHASYFYNSLRIGPDHRVTCQNCNRLFGITSASDIS